MMQKSKECVAMLLAGGQGSRLMALTESTAKPAVPFGGKYRIIDFPLSNCVNSGIDIVGILTQYQPLELNDYIGNGQPWGLNRNYGGVHILPPFVKSKKTEWYKGTANAVYQNISFIERYKPRYVIVLSGDHIYKMNYAKMLEYHEEKKSECTIAVRDVPIEEASRFGIMTLGKGNIVTKFDEKPKHPDSTKASMGIYIFNWRILKQYLIDDENNDKSANDFGKNIIPSLLEDRRRVFGYLFDGYWKDVGTITSLWEANMDLLGTDEKAFDLKDPDFKIYARNYAKPASFISKTSVIEHSLIAEGCSILGKVKNSIISTGCVIEENAEIINSVVMPDAVVDKYAAVKYSIIGEEARIGKNAKIGDIPDFFSKGEWGIAVVGNKKEVSNNTSVKSDEII